MKLLNLPHILGQAQEITFLNLKLFLQNKPETKSFLILVPLFETACPTQLKKKKV